MNTKHQKHSNFSKKLKNTQLIREWVSHTLAGILIREPVEALPNKSGQGKHGQELSGQQIKKQASEPNQQQVKNKSHLGINDTTFDIKLRHKYSGKYLTSANTKDMGEFWMYEPIPTGHEHYYQFKLIPSGTGLCNKKI